MNDVLGDDKYKVDREGNISLKRKNNKKFDKIVGRNSEGNRESLKLDKGVLGIMENKSTTVERQYQGENDKIVTSLETYDITVLNLPLSDGVELFEFLAQATGVEWSLFKFGENSSMPTGILSTSHDETSDIYWNELKDSEYFKESDFNGFDHIHPAGTSIPSGYFQFRTDKRVGDIGVLIKAEDIHRGKVLVFRIYTAHNKKYTEFNSGMSMEDDKLPGE